MNTALQLGSARTRGALIIVAVVALALSIPSVALAAVACDSKSSPPYGGSYSSINVPSATGTLNVYYSFWNATAPYYARRREADGTIRYESLRSGGGIWDFANCTNGVCTDVQRRTELKNYNGAVNWSYTIEAWNTTSLANC